METSDLKDGDGSGLDGSAATRSFVDRLAGSTSSLLLACLVGLAFGGLFVALVGVSPLDAYRAIWDGALGNRAAVGETLARVVPLALIALGLIPALRANVFSIGAEGQLTIGALTAGLTAIAFKELPGAAVIPLAAVAGAAGGALWALLPALMRAYLNLNEILTTLAFNFVATYVLIWLLNGPVRGPSANLPQTEVTPASSWLPTILSGTRAHIGIFVVLALALVMAFVERTSAGYKVRLAGANPTLAKSAGVDYRLMIVSTMLIGGAAAGLAGWAQVAGVDRAVYASVARGLGFVGVLVVILGGMRVAGTLVAAFFFAALATGGDFMQVSANVSPHLVGIVQGVALLFVASRVLERSGR